MVHDGKLDLLALNQPAGEMLSVLSRTGRFGRNIVYQAFTTTVLPDLLGEGAELFLRVAASELRTAISRYPADSYLRELLDELATTSPTFRDYWDRGEVIGWRSAVKHLDHPTHGWANFDIEVLHDPDRDHWIMLYTPHQQQP